MWNDKSLRLFEESSSFKFLKEYYSKDDFATRYGIDRMEIKHSNFLSWIFDYKKNNFGDYAIRKLLEFIIKKSDESSILKNSISNELKKIIQSEVYDLTEIEILRESFDIDILIKLIINDVYHVNIIIENKINASVGESNKNNEYKDSKTQLQKYRKIIFNKYESSTNLFLLLYPLYNDLKDKACKDKFEPITYQELYENVLIPILNRVNDYEMKLALIDYIHCLSKPINNYNSIIITLEEKTAIKELIHNFKDVLIKIADSRINKNIESEFYEFLETDNYKSIFKTIYNKCLNIEEKEFKEFVDIFKLVINKRNSKNYFENSKGEIRSLYNSEFVYEIIMDIIDSENIKKYKDFPSEIINSTNQKLIIPEDSIEINRKDIYRLKKIKNDKPIILDGIRYFYLYNVLSDEVDRLKNAVIKCYPKYIKRIK